MTSDASLFRSIRRSELYDRWLDKCVEGVTGVVNNIEALPLFANDDRVRIAAYSAIYGDSVLSTRYGFRAMPSMHIIAKNGDIRLVGAVANEGGRASRVFGRTVSMGLFRGQSTAHREQFGLPWSALGRQEFLGFQLKRVIQTLPEVAFQER